MANRFILLTGKALAEEVAEEISSACKKKRGFRESIEEKEFNKFDSFPENGTQDKFNDLLSSFKKIISKRYYTDGNYKTLTHWDLKYATNNAPNAFLGLDLAAIKKIENISKCSFCQGTKNLLSNWENSICSNCATKCGTLFQYIKSEK